MFGFLNMLQRWNLGVIRGSRLVPTRVPPRQTPLALPTPVPSAHSRLLSRSTSTATQEALCVPPWIYLYNKDNLYDSPQWPAVRAGLSLTPHAPRHTASVVCRVSSVGARQQAGRHAHPAARLYSNCAAIPGHRAQVWVLYQQCCPVHPSFIACFHGIRLCCHLASGAADLSPAAARPAASQKPNGCTQPDIPSVPS